jgi:hypothetical protein
MSCCQDSRWRDMPDDHLPDPDETADFELKLPDQQALIDAFTAGLCKESQQDFRSLSTLLATLPDPSLSYGHVKAKKETVPQRGGVPGRPVGRPASRRRATAWRPQTGRPTGRAAAPWTLRPGRRGPAQCDAVPRNTSGHWTVNELISTIKLIKSTDFTTF